MATRGEDGFTLVEALMACALLVIVLVPALSAFRAQIAATNRRAMDLSAAIALEDLAGRVEEAVARTNFPGATSERLPRSRLLLSDPEEVARPVGPATLLRFRIASLPDAGDEGRKRMTDLYAIAPVETNEAAR